MGGISEVCLIASVDKKWEEFSAAITAVTIAKWLAD